MQYGGHHLAVNVTVDGADMTLAPTFWGAQPASYESAGTSAEPLCGETTKAFALVDALDETQQQEAILDSEVTEIVLGAGQDGKTLAQEGVSASTFTAEQKALLLDLVDEWITPLNPDDAAAKLAAAEQNLDQTTFAWYGSTEIGNPIYYRVQGPTFTIEFAHRRGRPAALRDARRVRAHRPTRPHARCTGGAAVRPHRRCRRRRRGLAAELDAHVAAVRSAVTATVDGVPVELAVTDTAYPPIELLAAAGGTVSLTPRSG